MSSNFLAFGGSIDKRKEQQERGRASALIPATSALRLQNVTRLGNVMGNPWVSQTNPYPHPQKPIPVTTGTGRVWVYPWVSDLITLYNYNIKIKYLIYKK